MLILLLAGVLHAWSLAWPAFVSERWAGDALWGLQLVTQAIFFGFLWFQLQDVKTEQKGFRSGFQGSLYVLLFAMAWLVATIWWLYISMHFVGGLPSVLAAAAVLALAAFLASYYVLTLALWRKVSLALGDFSALSTYRMILLSLALAAAWTLAEVLRGWVFTGFPWGAVGYAHVSGPFSVWAPWVGVYGIGALSSWVAALLGLAAFLIMRSKPAASLNRTFSPARWQRVLIPLAMAMAMVVIGLSALTPRFVFTQDKPSFEVALLQANIGQAQKFDPAIGVPQALDWYGQHLQSEQAPLIITPETAIPMFAHDLPTGYLEAIETRLRAKSQIALVGIPSGSGNIFSNSAILLGSSEQAGPWRYDKHHLVPFGEFIPPLFGWFVRAMGIPLADFQAGDAVQEPVRFAGNDLGVNICYEDLFGEELARAFVSQDYPAPSVMVNMSNIAWFGPTTALPQHLAISRMRALEFERPMLRATNTGATAHIDHRGEVQALLDYETQGVLQAQVAGRTGLTPYAFWAGHWGLWPLLLFSLFTLALPLAIRGRGAT